MKAKGISAAAWFYGQPGFHAQSPVVAQAVTVPPCVCGDARSEHAPLRPYCTVCPCDRYEAAR